MERITTVPPNQSVSVGQTRMSHGTVEIYSGQKWVEYPPAAAALLLLATECGWGFDDGLPAIGGSLKLYQDDGLPRLRLLVGRERGERVLPDDTREFTCAYQFHVTWDMRPASWRFASAWMKTSRDLKWTSIEKLRDVRGIIVSNAVINPSIFAR
jgi:hypothetical protein